MVKYKDAKSKFVKQEIKRTEFADRQHIDNLIFLENYILGKVKLLWSTSFILNNYAEGYKKILMELDPERYRKEMKFEKKEAEQEKKEEEQMKKEDLLEEEMEKKDWIAAGGIVK